MSDGATSSPSSRTGSVMNTPPPAPNPNTTTQSIPPIDSTHLSKSDEPPRLDSPDWDIHALSGLAALRLLQRSLEALTAATGDVPPTPPVHHLPARRPSLSPLNPSSRAPSPASRDIGAEAQDHYIQHAAISRRFFSKAPPSISITAYLERLHAYTPHSPGVYLAAATYIHRLCVATPTLPATPRTIHRLTLTAIRVAAKALEDNKWSQERVAAVGGVGKVQLMGLEVTLCFLMDFELKVDEGGLARGMWGLVQAGRQGGMVKGPLLRDVFRLRLPEGKRGVVAAAS